MELQKSLQVNISSAKDALLFGDNSTSVYDAVSNQFKDCVHQKVKKLKDNLLKRNVQLYTNIMEKWADLSPQMDLLSLFLYPETLNRLLGETDPQETGKYLEQALNAERAKRDNIFDTSLYGYLWTMNGDFLLQCNKESRDFEAFESFKLNDVLPLDFFSPYCIKVNALELQELPDSVIDEYDYSGAYSICEQIYECLEVLNDKKSAKGINDLIYKFTNVIILKRQNHELTNRHFFSSSDGNYIGRTVLGNVELVNHEILIDSIIHEATHALLYMIDEKFQWQPSTIESYKLGNVIFSPWSGNMLSVRNYLQAIFVWYALFNLWQYSLKEQVYDPAFAQRRISMIRNGFLQVDIHKLSKELNCQLDQILIETVIDIKEYVIRS